MWHILFFTAIIFCKIAHAIAPTPFWQSSVRDNGRLLTYQSNDPSRGILIPLSPEHPITSAPFPEVMHAEHLSTVTVPTIEFFFNPIASEKEKALPVILIAPGGGYACLSYQKEGLDIARDVMRLNCHAAVLKYPIRVPNTQEKAVVAAHQALTLLERHAQFLKINPSQIGMMGFSAGAHLTAKMLAHPNHPLAFAILIYPAYLSDDGKTLKPDVYPAPPYVPTFVMQCRDDRSYLNASLGYVTHLATINAPVSYHLYPNGGHGFGNRITDNSLEVATWFERLQQWFFTQIHAPTSQSSPPPQPHLPLTHTHMSPLHQTKQ